MSDSATGGYLVESGTPQLNDQSLRRFIHGVIAGVTALPGGLVRQGWQLNPSPIPSVDVDWISFSITNQRPDNAPYQCQPDELKTEMSRHEEFDVVCNFYGDNCQANSSNLRDGMYITQNLEQLFLADMGLVGFSETTHVPELINDRFFDRMDITMSLRRQIKREYPIFSFVSVNGIISSQASTTVIIETFDTQFTPFTP